MFVGYLTHRIIVFLDSIYIEVLLSVPPSAVVLFFDFIIFCLKFCFAGMISAFIL